MVDVGAADIGALDVLGAAAPGDRDELALAIEYLGLGDEIDVGVRHGSDVGALRAVGFGHPEKPTGIAP